MGQTLTFRSGRPEDSSDLALLFDAAGRRVPSWYWSTLAKPGQSWFEVGRDRIRNQEDVTSHHTKWHIAEEEGRMIGAFFGFSVPDPYDRIDLDEVEAPFVPVLELEMAAKGCWLLQAVAVFSEDRGQGHGPTLLAEACRVARAVGHSRIVLQVESPNIGAIGLYRKFGFSEWQRRPFIPFPGSDDEGEWILMVKDL